MKKTFLRLSTYHRVLLIGAVILALVFGTMFGVSRWYAYTVKDDPYKLGVSFIPAYASYLGVEPKETLDALINDLNIRHFRFVSYWNEIESVQGTYDFSQLDWQFEKAEESGSQVSLAIGLRQPRWPECHEPDWVDISDEEATWYPALEKYMTAVINRYKDSPALASYQLENEYFLSAFGECQNFSRQRLEKEHALVKSLDSKHPLIISRSNNAQGIAVNEPAPDIYAVSVYKRVWSPPVGRYVEYPFPGWYYGYLAGWQKIYNDKKMIIHELQAEPWPPSGKPIVDTPLEEQNKSFDTERFEDRFGYARSSGMREVYFWGAEYWYYRMEVLGDESVWNVAKAAWAAKP